MNMQDQRVLDYSPAAEQALDLARQEASRLNHDFVATEHLLLGIIGLGQSTAVTVLRSFGLDLDAVRLELEEQLGIGPDHQCLCPKTKVTGHLPKAAPPGSGRNERAPGIRAPVACTGNLPYTPRVKKVLAFAVEEARALNHSSVGAELILLGLLREGDGAAARVLKEFGVDTEKTRQEILR